MSRYFIVMLGMLMWVLPLSAKRATESGSPEWKQSFPGVWVSRVSTPEEYNLLNAINSKPVDKVLNAKSEREFPIALSSIKYSVINGRTFITLPADQDEQFYGLGINYIRFNQRKSIKLLHMDHGSSDNGRSHAPVPFLISSKGYGLLINSARYITSYVTTGVRKDSKNPPRAVDRNDGAGWTATPYSDNVEFLIPAEGVELIMFSGEDMMDVVARYNLYCGGGFIPPKWGLGFWHRTPTKYSDKDIIKESKEFASNDFPLDVIGLEPGWHSSAYPCTFEWDKERYPDVEGFSKIMADMNVKLNLWGNPYLAESGSLYKKMEKYAGSHTVWCGIVPDYTIPKARKLFKDHIIKNQLELGVSGYKVDEVDGRDNWLWPDVAIFPSGKDGEQMRSTYANLVMDIIFEAFKERNIRTYGMTRGANVGASKLPFVLYSDAYLHSSLTAGIPGASFVGVHWTAEVRGGKSAEDWLRRMQVTCFSPLSLINAWADKTKPWSFPEVYQACQDVAKLRMRLLPYIYSTFAQYYFEGIPPFRAMNLVEGYKPQVIRKASSFNPTTNPYAMDVTKEVADQYMMGDNILVAPIFAGVKTRQVNLPKGKWYDFYTGKFVGESEIITIDAPKDKIALFVRDGAIIPMIPPVNNTSKWSQGQPLEVRVYGTKPATFKLYDDDGQTFDYEKGVYTIKELSTDKKVKTLVDKGGWSYTSISWKQM